MRISVWLLIVLLIIAALVGAGGILTSIAFNRYTSTEAFCTGSCHTMVLQAADPYFEHSAHRSNNEGVRPSCGDCHIPATNWFVETYTHVTTGMHDLFVELTHDFRDPKVWEARRVGLEQEVHATIRAQDSVTCRSCHDADAIKPTSADGQKAHALLRQGGVTCIDCHTNLVHPPAQQSTPSPTSR